MPAELPRSPYGRMRVIAQPRLTQYVPALPDELLVWPRAVPCAELLWSLIYNSIQITREVP